MQNLYRLSLPIFWVALCVFLLLGLPVFPQNVSAEADETVQPDDMLVAPPPPALAGDIMAGPSQFMAGRVAVWLILPESNGSAEPSSEDWTPQQIEKVTHQVQAALDWWEERLPLAHLDFQVKVQVVETAYEPVMHGLSDEGLWIGDVLGRLGYSGTYFDKAYAAVSDLRRQQNSDWATLMFVANSANNGPGRFNDGRFAYAYIHGPFMVLTSDVGSYSADRMAPVVAHEMGHIFGALDQYSLARVPCDRRSGYLNAPTSNSQYGNCPTSLPSIMLSPLGAYENGDVDPSALAQVGYRDSDGDGVIDPLDTTVELSLDPLEPYTPGTRPRFTGTSADVGFASLSQRTTTINTIARVEYRVDGGAWSPAHPGDGAFDTAVEHFYVEAPLYDGAHLVEFRAINSLGFESPVHSATVQISQVGSRPNYQVSGPDVSNSTDILLRLEAPSDTQEVQVSCDPLMSEAAWQPYQPELQYQIDDAFNGSRQVYVRFRDGRGFISPLYQHQMLLDTQPPVGQVVLQRGAGMWAVLTAQDQGTGVAAVELEINDAVQVVQVQTTDMATQGDSQWLSYRSEIELPSDTVNVRARFLDAAGNVSAFVDAGAYLYLPLAVK